MSALVSTPVVGSLVYVPGTSFAPWGALSPSSAGLRGYVGIVQSVSGGRLGCFWFDLNWRPVGSDVVAASAVSPWSPGVGCGAGCAPVVGFGRSCAGCGYRS